MRRLSLIPWLLLLAASAGCGKPPMGMIEGECLHQLYPG